MGARSYGLDPVFVREVALELAEAHREGVQVGVVVGGGNIFRGVSESARDMDRVNADTIGMLATVINALTLQDALEKLGVQTSVQSALAMPQVADLPVRRNAEAHLEAGSVVIFAGGTGSPFFTTDTAAGLRALEIGADLLVKATKVDGVYSEDPVVNPQAHRYERLSYQEVLTKGLQVMDGTAIALCQEHNMPILVCSIRKRGTLRSLFQSHAGHAGHGSWIGG